ncbi:MAG: lipopolysaccharide heptosyltransferase II [Kiritimatiellae bacterium]|nr:lipopolysaccharide heptosyltransferase II [Kiritimatiellia bacterium]
MSVDSRNILICGLNWLGDTVMSMPALQLFKARFPSDHVTMVVVSGLAGFWEMCPSVDTVISRQPGSAGMWAAIQDVKAGGFDRSFIFPNSPRSTLLPYLAGVPARRGVRGSYRSWLLTDVVEPMTTLQHKHQAWEYVDILGMSKEDCSEWGDDVPAPILDLSVAAVSSAEGMLGNGDYIAFLPGAARGPAKQWPPEHFIDLGRRLIKSTNCRVAILGAPNEKSLCLQIADGIGACADSFAGKTSIPELVAVLGQCSVVVTNDSGGMHLATAAGCRVVGIFGLTDHVRTGPLGVGHRIVAAESVQTSRDIPRDSPEARAAMFSITPDRVHGVVQEVIAESRGICECR